MIDCTRNTFLSHSLCIIINQYNSVTWDYWYKIEKWGRWSRPQRQSSTQLKTDKFREGAVSERKSQLDFRYGCALVLVSFIWHLTTLLHAMFPWSNTHYSFTPSYFFFLFIGLNFELVNWISSGLLRNKTG